MSNEYESTIRELQSSLMRAEEENKKFREQALLWMKNAEKFSIEAINARTEMIALKSTVWEIKENIANAGPVPKYHYHVMRKHRSEWPALWKSIDKLIK
jgi:hypothetical protein